ncbi:MAG: glycoside hydrolase, partial [Propionibacteriaceae bacterium]|nr:glycoside hydrolase [Propionibacteriaceae bacterium]
MYTGIDTIYLIHHSHTDIGYTHDQPIVSDLHRRFTDTALDQCERDADSDSDHAFRWTVETTAMLLHWNESAPAPRVARFVELAKAGR